MWFYLMSSALAGEHTALVGFEAAQDAEFLHRLVASRGGEARGCFHGARVCALHFPGTPPIAELQALPGVRHAERDGPIPLAQQAEPPPAIDASGTSDCADQWELVTVRASEAWGTVTGADAAPVAIADSGFLLSHEEIEDRIWTGYDYGDGDPIPEVSWSSGVPGHGTFIGGLIVANGDNGVGRAGLMPDGQLALYKIADRSGNLNWSYAIDALNDLVLTDDSRVLSYSLASTSSNASFEDAVAALGDADILLVTAAANCAVADCWDGDNDAFPVYPANLDGAHILSVAGTMDDDSLNPYSHYGATTVDLAAPGDDLCSLGVDSDDDYEVESGTSYATPLVAAAAGLLFEAWPGLSAPEAARVLNASVEAVTALDGLVASGGRLDVAAALATPMPRLEQPDPLTLDGVTSVSWTLGNAAAEGEATLVVFHEAEIEILSASAAGISWTITRYDAGDSVTLPDGDGAISLSGASLTLLSGALPAASSVTLDLEIQGARVAESEGSVRMIATSDEAAPLRSPWEEGTPDASGADAWRLAFDVKAAVVVEDTGPVDTGSVDTGPVDSGWVDSGDGAAKDSVAPDGDPTGDGKGTGCACASGPDDAAPLGLVAALGLALATRRRRR